VTAAAAPTSNGVPHGERPAEHDEVRAGPDGAERVLRFVRGLPRAVQLGLKEHPAAIVAGVGATAFVLGALCGSRVGRVLMTTLAGYGVRRFIEGPVVREVARYATDVMKHAEAGA
jgi:hypothetical protein